MSTHFTVELPGGSRVVVEQNANDEKSYVIYRHKSAFVYTREVLTETGPDAPTLQNFRLPTVSPRWC